ncbi:sugar ABC transporter permease [Paenibacillus thiaminolyticus]|uniref:Sugar ABC transporter permease n=1 Tax=Paenibacillus thiaminolyticus TaxID=49283 RepID=A0AAP9DVB1_PANTH|nr:sugar ABC transporter permease [Paenibacillus thiaminolyticus]MCY9538429.1 sugar ABC transporter permease [Paenibacillus thiaminolyticus]MCY9604336.1 sugar ABC transporter permease [Paenibacillus thiaminolyticus]MCY9609566.1 sugar ABC transporter permease [Paenibacillus thiaminolyticus]MCY9616042.1 sugar ABC transporter permease [Paenibacillus thiaminolyticus]MCY9621439.1 sugar ABC transporter permease [Paenibacillus thiaminolyticus]
MKALAKNGYLRQKKILILGFTVFPIVFLLTFTYWPMLNMVWYSFTSWDGISNVKEFVGLDNYVRVLNDPQYFSVFKVSLYYIAGSVLNLFLSLFIATILNFKLKFSNFFKGVLFFPYLINGVAVAMIFLFFFQPDGVLDSFLSLLGLNSWIQQWLGNPNLINPSMVFVSMWKGLGFAIVLYLGAMQSIDNSVYEAANVDGANGWQVFKSIIIPSIKPVLTIQIILSVKGALSVFEIPFIMTNGANGSMTFVIQTIKTGFNYNKVGLASSMAMILFIIIIIMTVVQKFILKEEK